MLETEAFIFRSRPSSHSSEYTISVTYRSVEDSEKTYGRLRRVLEDMKGKPNKRKMCPCRSSTLKTSALS